MTPEVDEDRQSWTEALRARARRVYRGVRRRVVWRARRAARKVLPRRRAGASVPIDIPADLTGWKEIERRFADRLREHFDARGVARDDRARDVTLRTNTVLVPQRAELLLAHLAAHGGPSSLEGRRVLEIGCGFGALAAYLAWRGRPATLTAVDIDPRALEIARHVAADDSAAAIAYVEADTRDLSMLARHSADVVVANNSLLYLPTAGALQDALDELGRVTAPGGAIVVYQANRWRLREPFTGDPVMHLLPARVARLVARVTGWRHNHGRVRVVSPIEIRRRLRSAGFADVVTLAVGAPATARAPRRHLGGFFVTVGLRGDGTAAGGVPRVS